MQNPVIESEVGKLIEENKELRERIEELEKRTNTMNDSATHSLSEFLIQIKESKEKLEDFTARFQTLSERKEGIDKIIEKIKKLLPIK